MRNPIILAILAFLCTCCGNKQVTQTTDKWELAPDIYFLDKDNPIESLAELIIFFKDKPFYIDRWATWCSPCIEEFNHNDSLHKFLKDNKIEIVYLNSDQEINDSALYQFIIYHNLKGNHLRLNDSLKKDLTQKKIFIPRIPQYIIISKSGKVLENNAFRPSDGQKLYDQLRENIN